MSEYIRIDDIKLPEKLIQGLSRSSIAEHGIKMHNQAIDDCQDAIDKAPRIKVLGRDELVKIIESANDRGYFRTEGTVISEQKCFSLDAAGCADSILSAGFVIKSEVIK